MLRVATGTGLRKASLRWVMPMIRFKCVYGDGPFAVTWAESGFWKSVGPMTGRGQSSRAPLAGHLIVDGYRA
jgi:hypothetical protein